MNLKFVVIILVHPITNLITGRNFRPALPFFVCPFFLMLAKRQLELVLEFAVLIAGSAYPPAMIDCFYLEYK